MDDNHDHNTIANNQITGSNISIGDGAKQTIYTPPQREQEQRYQAPPVPVHRPPNGKTQIFLSHSSNDSAFSTQLAQSLLTLGYDVWCDIERLNAGDAWWQRIKQELTARSFFLIVLSPDAVISPWVNDELTIAWQQRNSPTGKHIIPILYRMCELPVELTTLQYVSFIPPILYQEALNRLVHAINKSISR